MPVGRSLCAAHGCVWPDHWIASHAWGLVTYSTNVIWASTTEPSLSAEYSAAPTIPYCLIYFLLLLLSVFIVLYFTLYGQMCLENLFQNNGHLCQHYADVLGHSRKFVKICSGLDAWIGLGLRIHIISFGSVLASILLHLLARTASKTQTINRVST